MAEAGWVAGVVEGFAHAAKARVANAAVENTTVCARRPVRQKAVEDVSGRNFMKGVNVYHRAPALNRTHADRETWPTVD